MPHLMNCMHSEDGWCLDCVKEMHDESERLHREDSAGFAEVWKELTDVMAALSLARKYAADQQKKHPIGLRAFAAECGVSASKMSSWTSGPIDTEPDII